MISVRLLQVLLLLCLIALCSCVVECNINKMCRRKSINTRKEQPRLMLWSWEHRDDLRFIDTGKTGIAFLVYTITLKGDRVFTCPRFQPIRFPADAYKMAVIRIESSRQQRPTLSSCQRASLVEQLISRFGKLNVQSWQIDFDATFDQRTFYRQVLGELRSKMPAGIPLSITALSSWCLKDVWIRNMPCDEVVPMFFQMGVARKEAMDLLAKGQIAKLPMQQSIGFSVDELKAMSLVKTLPEHVYLFSPQGWNDRSAQGVARSIESAFGAMPNN